MQERGMAASLPSSVGRLLLAFGVDKSKLIRTLSWEVVEKHYFQKKFSKHVQMAEVLESLIGV